MKGIEHIFFDLDHTLWDFDTNSQETLEELFHSFNLGQLGNGSSSAEFYSIYIEHNDRLWDDYRNNRVSKGRLRKLRFERAFAEIGIEDKRLARNIGDVYMDVCPLKSKLNDGAIELLDAIRDAYQLHILSNGFQETQITKLKSSGILEYFQTIITSERANSRKPKPEMYAYAKRITGAQPEESLMIGDGLDIDVKGALDAGWRAVHFDPSRKGEYNPCVGALTELIPILLESR